MHSVASFFVSRVDSEVDRRLEPPAARPLRARRARQRARRLQSLQGGLPRRPLAQLRDAGAPVQRPLWASTGVKKPALPRDAVRRRAGRPDSVNTMPLPTLLAAARDAKIGGATVEADPQGDLDALREAASTSTT